MKVGEEQGQVGNGFNTNFVGMKQQKFRIWVCMHIILAKKEKIISCHPLHI